MDLAFFAPYSAIWQHAFPEAVLAESFQQLGHTVYYIVCNGTLNAGCIAMKAAGQHNAAPDIREKTCQRCHSYRDTLLKQFNFKVIFLDDHITAQDKQIVDSALNNLSTDNFLNFQYQGVPIGKMALYTVILKHKKMDYQLNEAQWKEYLVETKLSLYMLLAGTTILSTISAQKVFVYNSSYGTSQALSSLCDKKGIGFYHIHSSNNLSNPFNALRIGKKSTFFIVNHMIQQWYEIFQHTPCPKQVFSKVHAHYQALFSAKSVFVYSSPSSGKNVRDYFNIPPHQTITLATLSSQDEIFAAQSIGEVPLAPHTLFPTQIEWLTHLAHFYANKPEHCLIIRIHPREFPNKREGIKSEHAAQLEALFATFPSNIKINLPADNLSLYEIAKESAIGLNYISSAGLELSLLGLPVLTHAPQSLLMYPLSLLYTAHTAESYDDTLTKLLYQKERLPLERLRAIYRWYAVEFLYAEVDLSDSIHFKEVTTRSFSERVWGKIQRSLYPTYPQQQDCRLRAPVLKEQPLLKTFMDQHHDLLVSCPRNFELLSEEEEWAAIKEASKVLVGMTTGGRPVECVS
jgi:hypothetical protein